MPTNKAERVYKGLGVGLYWLYIMFLVVGVGNAHTLLKRHPPLFTFLEK